MARKEQVGLVAAGLASALLLTTNGTQAQIQIQARQGQAIQIQGALIQRGRPGAEGQEGLDESAAFQTDRESMLRLGKAEEMIKDARWADAVLYLGAVLDGPEDFFFPADEQKTSFRSLKARALELIVGMPAEGRAAYELEYGPAAQKLLDQAIESGSPEALAEVSRRFLHTKAGYEAAHRLAMYHYDHGRPLAAALFFERLGRIPEAKSKLGPLLLIKIAACLDRVGTDEARDKAGEYLKELRTAAPSGKLMLAGKPVDVPNEPNLAWLRQTLGPQVQQAQPGKEEWVMVGGNPARNAASVGGPPLLNFRWRNPTYDVHRDVVKRVREMRDNFRRAPTAMLPAMSPLAVKLDPREVSLFGDDTIGDWPEFIGRMKGSQAGPEQRLWSLLSPALRDQLAAVGGDQQPPLPVRQQVVAELNTLLARPDFYVPEIWADIELRMECEPLLRQGVDKLPPEQLLRLNRLLIESVFRSELASSFVDVVLMRTYHNLVAMDFVTGKRVWEVKVREGEDFLDRVAAGTTSSTRGQSQEGILLQRLWRDCTFGTMSSDGRLVFSVEGLDPGAVGSDPRVQVINRPGAGEGGLRTVNRLAAHDLRTGKEIWTAGDPADKVKVALPGTYFLGPPLPLAGHLYTLAEQGGEVRLLVLDAQTGRLQWSQNLAQAQQLLLSDQYRRFAGVSPSYADGILVCPTGAGAVVAVDLTSRSLLWGYRYGGQTATGGNEFQLFANGSIYVSPAVQGEKWADSLAVLDEGCAIVTPVESEQLHCLSLVDGRKLWSQDRGDSLYVAAVRQGQVVLVGSRQVRGLSLADGSQLWSTGLPDAPHTMPAGRGFLSENRYFVPLTNGEVVSLDLDRKGHLAGGVRARGEAADSGLGNLICFKGTVLSQDVEFLQSFDELTVLERQVAADLTRNPKDSTALARRGEILLQKGDVASASADFRLALSLEREPDPRVRQLLVDSLLEGLRVDFATNRPHVDEARALIEQLPESDRPGYRGRFLRLLAAGLQAVGDRQAAFATYLEFARPGVESADLERIDGSWEVRRDRWAQARLAELFNGSPEAQRTDMDRVVQERLQEAIESRDAPSLERFLSFFGAHPIAARARDALLERFLTDKQWLAAELLLRPDLAPDAPLERRGRAVALITNILLQAERNDDAAMYLRLLQGPLADVVYQDGKTGREIVEALPPDGLARKLLAGTNAWPTGKVETKNTSGGNNSGWRLFPVAIEGPQDGFFPQGSIVLDQQARKFLGRDAAGREVWQAALPEENKQFGHIGRNPFGNSAQTLGHLVLLNTGQHVFALDTLNPANPGRARLLWTIDLFDGLPGVTTQQGVQIQFQVNPAGRRWIRATDMYNQPIGPVGPVTSRYISLVRRRDLMVVDPMSGQTLWVRHDCQPGSAVFGDEEFLFVITPGANEATVLRAMDGQKVGTRPVPAESKHLLARGRCLYTWEEKGNRWHLTCHDLANGEIRWKKDFANKSRARLVDGEAEVAVYDQAGQLTILSLADGKVLVDSAVEADNDADELYVLKSGDRFVAVVSRPANQKGGRFIRPITNGIDNPVVTGNIYGFDMATGQKLWTTKVEDQALALRQHARMPVLVFAARVAKQDGRRWTNVCQVLVLDKRTGRKLYEKSYENESINGYDIQSDRDKRQIELQLTRQTITLEFTDKPWPEEPTP